jgi:hypothetical protein
MGQLVTFSVLQTVRLADRCFLCELLYWVALRRFPFAIADPYDKYDDFRFSQECDLDTSSFVEAVVTFAECEYSGLPPNPRYRALLEDGFDLEEENVESIGEYNERFLNTDRFSDADRAAIRDGQDKLLAELREKKSWDRGFEHYLEYIKTKVFLDLRDGTITGSGIKVKGSSWQEICDSVSVSPAEIELKNQEHLAIGQTEWIPSKIDWRKSILYGKEFSYVWVNFEVDSMLSVYPIPELPAIGSVRKLCDAYLLDRQNLDDAPPLARRGRPPFPWEEFHVEVAALIQKNALPEKKEAAIADFERWFRDRFGIPVGRTAIGQKLKPYYQKFLPSNSQKDRG